MISFYLRLFVVNGVCVIKYIGLFMTLEYTMFVVS